MKKLLWLALFASVVSAGCEDSSYDPASDDLPESTGDHSSIEQGLSESGAEEDVKKKEKFVKEELSWDIQEEVLFIKPEDHEIMSVGRIFYPEQDIYFGEGGKRFAYIASKEGRERMISVIDGEEVEWTDIDELFGELEEPGNYKRVKPVQRRGDFYFVYNGKTLGELGEVPGDCYVSKDGSQYAYIIVNTSTWERTAVVNGVKGPGYKIIGMKSCSPSHTETCGPFAFAYDGKQHAYIAKKSDSVYAIVINGKERETYREIDFPAFSPDSEHFVYKATDEKAFMVIDGEEQKKYDSIYNVRFKQDGTLMYNAMLDSQILLVTQNYKGEN
jgi:hypothetical protein